MSGPRLSIFYHGDCQDGFGAAWCAWRRFGTAADYRPMHYGDAWPMDLVAGREVYILDFSAPHETLRELAREAARVVLLDHHATPFHDWGLLLRRDEALGVDRHDEREPALTVAFDMARSGARLAWDWFFPGEPVPRTIAHVEDQDLWRFASPDTRAYCRALRARPYDFATWDRLADESGSLDDAGPTPAYRQMLLEGAAVEAFFRREVDRLAVAPTFAVRLRAEPLDADGAARDGPATIVAGGKTYRAVDGLAVNANSLFASELGEALARRSGSFGMTWYVRGDGRVKVSLRAAGAVDVARVAEQYGGGGHPNSAGITVDLDLFVREILRTSG